MLTGETHQQRIHHQWFVLLLHEYRPDGQKPLYLGIECQLSFTRHQVDGVRLIYTNSCCRCWDPGGIYIYMHFDGNFSATVAEKRLASSDMFVSPFGLFLASFPGGRGSQTITALIQYLLQHWAFRGFALSVVVLGEGSARRKKDTTSNNTKETKQTAPEVKA